MRPMEKTALVVAACCVLAVAGVFRFHALSARPLHGDEANQAVRLARRVRACVRKHLPATALRGL